MSEVLRVLVPDGVAYIKSDGEWTKTVKPRPAEIDDWTHYLHDSSNNAVAHDTSKPYHRLAAVAVWIVIRISRVSPPLWSLRRRTNNGRGLSGFEWVQFGLLVSAEGGVVLWLPPEVRFFRHCRANEWSSEKRPGGQSHQGQEGPFTRPGYPLSGCSPAEPDSVSPGDVDSSRSPRFNVFYLKHSGQ